MLTLDRFQPPKADEGEAKVLCLCSCGCGYEICEGYEHVEYDGEWFYDEGCLFKYLDAKWRVAG